MITLSTIVAMHFPQGPPRNLKGIRSSVKITKTKVFIQVSQEIQHELIDENQTNRETFKDKKLMITVSTLVAMHFLLGTPRNLKCIRLLMKITLTKVFIWVFQEIQHDLIDKNQMNREIKKIRRYDNSLNYYSYSFSSRSLQKF